MVERRSPKPDVEGSSPSGRDFKEVKGLNMDNSFNALLDSIKKYFRGVRAEWGKITWPEKNQVVMETIFVVVIVSAFTLAVYLMDIIFKYSLPAVAKMLSKLL